MCTRDLKIYNNFNQNVLVEFTQILNDVCSTLFIEHKTLPCTNNHIIYTCSCEICIAFEFKNYIYGTI